MSRIVLPALLLLASTAAAQRASGSPPALSTGGTLVTGTAHGTWTPERSPYRLVGQVVVDELVVEAGVVVVAGPQASLLVRGGLQVLGTAAEPVVFRALRPAAGWRGVEFATAREPSRLRHAHVSGATHSGLRIVDSQVRLEHTAVEGNRSQLDGGGVHASLAHGDLVLLDSRVANNDAERYGGGLYADLADGSLVLVRCRVEGNRVNGARAFLFLARGGGLAVDDATVVELTDTRIAGNEIDAFENGVRAQGGGLSVRDAALVMTRCVVSSNRAWALDSWVRGDGEALGGGLFFEGNGTNAQLRNCLFSGNEAGVDANGGISVGSAIGAYSGHLSMVNCTVARNHMILGMSWTPDYGQVASVNLLSATAAIENSIVYGNTYSGFFGLWFPPMRHQLAGGAILTQFSDVEGGFAGASNLDLDPLFHAPGTSYAALSLLDTSPAVDAGNPEALYDDVAFPPSQGGPRNDMGMNGGPRAGGWLGSPAK